MACPGLRWLPHTLCDLVPMSLGDLLTVRGEGGNEGTEEAGVQKGVYNLP